MGWDVRYHAGPTDVRPFLPRHLRSLLSRRQIMAATQDPTFSGVRERFPGTVLCIDVLGWSRLSEALLQDGGHLHARVQRCNIATLAAIRAIDAEPLQTSTLQPAAKRLNASLCTVFAPMAAAIAAAGGDLVSLSGQSLVAVFRGPPRGSDNSEPVGSPAAALRCAAAVAVSFEKTISSRSVLMGPGYRKKTGTPPERLLRLRVALATGELQIALMGGGGEAAKLFSHALLGAPLFQARALLKGPTHASTKRTGTEGITLLLAASMWAQVEAMCPKSVALGGEAYAVRADQLGTPPIRHPEGQTLSGLQRAELWNPHAEAEAQKKFPQEEERLRASATTDFRTVRGQLLPLLWAQLPPCLARSLAEALANGTVDTGKELGTTITIHLIVPVTDPEQDGGAGAEIDGFGGSWREIRSRLQRVTLVLQRVLRGNGSIHRLELGGSNWEPVVVAVASWDNCGWGGSSVVDALLAALALCEELGPLAAVGVGSGKAFHGFAAVDGSEDRVLPYVYGGGDEVAEALAVVGMGSGGVRCDDDTAADLHASHIGKRNSCPVLLHNQSPVALSAKGRPVNGSDDDSSQLQNNRRSKRPIEMTAWRVSRRERKHPGSACTTTGDAETDGKVEEQSATRALLLPSTVGWQAKAVLEAVGHATSRLACAGVGGVLVLAGGAGYGKSHVLDIAVTAAERWRLAGWPRPLNIVRGATVGSGSSLLCSGALLGAWRPVLADCLGLRGWPANSSPKEIQSSCRKWAARNRECCVRAETQLEALLTSHFWAGSTHDVERQSLSADTAPMIPHLHQPSDIADKEAAVELVAHAVWSRARGPAPLMVVLDDTEWMDDASWDVVHRLACMLAPCTSMATVGPAASATVPSTKGNAKSTWTMTTDQSLFGNEGRADKFTLQHEGTAPLLLVLPILRDRLNHRIVCPESLACLWDPTPPPTKETEANDVASTSAKKTEPPPQPYQWMEIRMLSDTECGALLVAAAGAKGADTDVVGAVYADCGGNPGAILQWLAMSLRSGSVHFCSDGWLRAGHGAVKEGLPSFLPPSLSFDLNRVFVAAPADYKMTLALATALGKRAFSGDVLVQAHPMHLSEDSISAHVECMRKAGFIRPATPGGAEAAPLLPPGSLPATSWLWASDAIRMAIYASMTTRSRRDTHAAVANRLAMKLTERHTTPAEKRGLTLLLLEQYTLAEDQRRLLQLLGKLDGGPGLLLTHEDKAADATALKLYNPLELANLAVSEGLPKVAVNAVLKKAGTNAMARSGLIAMITSNRTFHPTRARHPEEEGKEEPVESAAVRVFPLSAILKELKMTRFGHAVGGKAISGSHIVRTQEEDSRWERVNAALGRWLEMEEYIAAVPPKAPGRFDNLLLNFPVPAGHQVAVATPKKIDWGGEWARALAVSHCQYPNMVAMDGETDALLYERTRLAERIGRLESKLVGRDEPILESQLPQESPPSLLKAPSMMMEEVASFRQVAKVGRCSCFPTQDQTKDALEFDDY